MNTDAIDWFMRSRDGDLAETEQKDFDAWLAESPVHVREYLQITELWGGLHARDKWPSATTEELLEGIRQASRTSISPYISSADGGLRPRSRAPRRLFIATAAVLLLCIAAAVVWQATLSAPSYATHRGEQRSLVLADGSVVQLNTLSKLIVRFDDERRQVELPSGEAFFRVARDANRPFEVVTPFARVRAVGTEFNVYNRVRSTRVAVLEGKVRVAVADSAESADHPRTLDLSAEQSADIAARGKIDIVSPRQSRPVAQTATAWMQRRIMLDNERVDSALAEFNRYNVVQLRIENADLAKVRITGGFNADDPAALLKYLERVHGLRTEQVDGNLVVLR